MHHSITFGNKNTWTDWHLVPSSRPIISAPSPKVQYVDIPGADGSIDLTESLAGRPVFSDREGNIEFIILNDYNIEGYEYDPMALYSEIMQYLHGRYLRMVLEDDPNYYYEGRFSIESWTPGEHNSTISITYRLSPYKYRIVNAIVYDPTDASKSDLERGSFTVVDPSAVPPTVTENATDTMARLKAGKERAYSAGDRIWLSGKFQFDLVLYENTGTTQSPVYAAKKYISSATMHGNSYTFTDSGFYRFDVRRMNYESGDALTEAELETIAESVHYYTGGIL